MSPHHHPLHLNVLQALREEQAPLIHIHAYGRLREAYLARAWLNVDVINMTLIFTEESRSWHFSLIPHAGWRLITGPRRIHEQEVVKAWLEQQFADMPDMLPRIAALFAAAPSSEASDSDQTV